jgi:hypothetical protein
MKFRIAIIAALATLATVAIAGQVADRSAAITITTGAATWTNNPSLYAAIELDRLDIIGDTAATDTATVYRVTSDGKLTNTVASIAIATGIGSYNIVPTTATGPKLLLKGDKVVFALTSTSNAVAYIDYIVQKH